GRVLEGRRDGVDREPRPDRRVGRRDRRAPRDALPRGRGGVRGRRLRRRSAHLRRRARAVLLRRGRGGADPRRRPRHRLGGGDGADQDVLETINRAPADGGEARRFVEDRGDHGQVAVYHFRAPAKRAARTATRKPAGKAKPKVKKASATRAKKVKKPVAKKQV